VGVRVSAAGETREKLTRTDKAKFYWSPLSLTGERGGAEMKAQ